MMNLGFNMEGTEERFEHFLHTAFLNRDSYDFSYLEIGIANCQTLFAVAEWTSVSMGERYNWFILGAEISDSPYFNAATFLRQCPFPCMVSKGHEHSIAGGIAVSLSGYLSRANPHLNFCLIDGCHGRKCVKHDFESIESSIYPGGIVAFHDACLEDQGGVGQHCGNGVEVREALRDLHLSPDSEGPYRKGWQFLEEAQGDKSRGGNGFVFVQKL